jgi:hypothetical protein
MEIALRDEVAGVDFGDKRLLVRLSLIAEAMGENPSLSIPGCLHGRAELEAAYRFFANEKVTPDAILATHYQRTAQRGAQYPVVLLVQDTSELDLTRPSQQVVGAGPMECESRRGAFIHPLMAFTPEGVPLGLAGAQSWTRSSIMSGQSAAEKKARKQSMPIEVKESMRWIHGLRMARQFADQCPETQSVCIADSEADIYELFAEPRNTSHGQPLELLIRACQDRKLSDESGSLLDAVRNTPCRYTSLLEVSAHKPKTKAKDSSRRKQERPARSAEVEIRVSSVTLHPPTRHDRTLPKVTLNVVLLEELSPPNGQAAIQWILVTTLPVDTDEAIRKIVTYYCQRWGIEVYFKTLKSGCRIEERQFEFLDRELNCVAVYMLVAWRILLLCRLGRTCPEVNCEVVFEPSEWRAVYIIAKRRNPPATPPSLNEIIRIIASLGGYVPRKNTSPGTQTLWIGLQRMHDFANSYDSFGPGAAQASTTCVER